MIFGTRNNISVVACDCYIVYRLNMVVKNAYHTFFEEIPHCYTP